MNVSIKNLFSLFAAAACLLLALKVLAQEAQPLPAQLPTQLVKLTMIVTDGKHHSVDDVRREEIQLEEEKQAQTIGMFSKDSRPVDYALVIDTTGSFRALLPVVVEAAKTLVNGNQADDQTFVESFVSSERVEKIQEFTSDRAQLNSALNALFVRGGQSAVIDAVYVAIKHTVEYKDSPPERRRAVVLFTDGEDRASYYNSDQLVKLIRENDVQVFIVGIVKQLGSEGSMIRTSPREKAELLLNRIAEESGGRVFFPENLKEVSNAITEIQHDLHSQYLVGFARQTKAGETGFRKLKFKVASSPGREKMSVIARPGYFLNVQTPVQRASEKRSP